ncbi:MAG: hypothetical protein ACHQQ3_03295 [Gemmatimonadales bacterium]
MTLSSKPIGLEYLGVALALLGGSFALIKWVGHTIRGQLGPGVSRGDQTFAPERVDTVPNALVKQAIERGLVTPSQLAGMSPVERQFLLASLQDKRAVAAPSGPTGNQIRVHCALCGEPLVLPASAPRITQCSRCGAQTAVREDASGRYVLNVIPAVKPDVS